MIVRLLICVVLLALAPPPPVGAAESVVATSPRAQVSLISESDSFTPGSKLRVALRMRMAPGWYTYWQNPGDAGAPPELLFTLPDDVQAGAIAWPAPERHPTGPIMSYGYGGEVVLPVTITVAGTADIAALVVQVHASWLVCERICVPEEAELMLSLPRGPPVGSAEVRLFAAADARMPRPSPWPAAVSPEGVLSVGLPGLDITQVREAWFAPLAGGQVEHSARRSVWVFRRAASPWRSSPVRRSTRLPGCKAFW